MDYSIGLLEHPTWTLTVLVYLQQHGSSHKSEMVENLGIARQSIYSAVDRLRELDVVFEDKKKGFPQKAYVDLTVQGRRLAESLVNVEGIVSETIKGFEKKLETLRRSEETAESRNEMADVLCRLGEKQELGSLEERPFDKGLPSTRTEEPAATRNMAKTVSQARQLFQGRQHWA